MDPAADDDVNSDEEFIVPPPKRAKTAVSGGKHSMDDIVSNKCTPLSSLCAASLRASSQSSLPLLGHHQQSCIGL